MEPMLTRAEAAKQLGVSILTLDRMTARGAVRVHRVGRLPRYLWSELVEDTREEPVSLAQALRRM